MEQMLNELEDLMTARNHIGAMTEFCVETFDANGHRVGSALPDLYYFFCEKYAQIRAEIRSLEMAQFDAMGVVDFGG